MIKVIVLGLFSFGLSAYCHSSTANKLSYHYYDIEVNKVSRLFDFVKKAGPKVGGRNAWATLNWDLNTEYMLRSTEDGCRLIANQVYVVGQATLPQWKNSHLLTKSDQKWWLEFSQFILEHEKNHYQNALVGVEHIVSNLKEQPISDTCSQAKQKYYSIKNDALNKVHKLDLKLDKLTRRRFASNERLFSRLKSGQNLVVQSSFIQGYMGL